MDKIISLEKRRSRTSCKSERASHSPTQTNSQPKIASKTPREIEYHTGIIEALDMISSDISIIELNYNEKLGAELQRVMQETIKMKKDSSVWEEFCAAPKWQAFRKRKPSSDAPKTHLYYVMRYVCGPQRNQQKNASFYLRALEVLVEEGVRTDQVANTIKKRGGLRVIVDQERERKKAMEANCEVIKPRNADAELMESDDLQQLEEETLPSSNSSANLAGKPVKASAMSTEPKSLRDRKSEIHIESSPDVFDILMKLEEGEETTCAITCLGKGDNDFVRLKFTHIAPI